MKPSHHVRLRRSRSFDLDEGSAFVPDFRRGFVASDDDDAEALGEEFIASATTGEAVAEEARNEPDGDELHRFALDSVLDDVDDVGWSP
jgi:hypothetical protein